MPERGGDKDRYWQNESSIDGTLPGVKESQTDFGR